MENHKNLIREEIYEQLPEELKKLTENFEGRERDMVLLSCIGVLSNCLPNIYGNYDGDDVYPQLFIIIVAPPASGKGVMNYARTLIHPIHKKILKDSRDLKSKCEKENKGKKREDCPELRIKILPANISTSEMYSYLGRSDHGLLIMESEADTMSSMLSNDWSNYSDLLRRAFHHEPISISRKMEDLYEDIEEPKLAMLLSGTQNQLRPLIKSTENGLYSRFIIYNFTEIGEFKDVFAEKTKESKIAFEKVGEEVYKLYGKLKELKKPVEFKLSNAQRSEFLKKLKEIRDDIIESHPTGFVSNLYRHGLILFRIAMIITSIRNKERLLALEQIKCNDSDFKLSMNLTLQLLRHSLTVYKNLKFGELGMQEEKLLNSLKKTFTTKEAYAIGDKLGIPKRTVDDKLLQWQKKYLARRIKKGFYSKIM